MSGAALLSGLLQGLQQGQQEKEERKERASKRKSDDLIMNYKIKELESQQKMQDMATELMRLKTGGGQPGAQPQPGQVDEGGYPISTEGFPGQVQQRGIVDALVGGEAHQAPAFSPMEAAIIKAGGGPDFTALPRAAETMRHNLAVEEAAKERIDWQKGAVTPVQEKIPGRGTVTRYMPEKILREGGSAFQTGLPETETHQYEEKGTTYSVIRNKRTGEEITKPVPIKEQKPLATETAGKLTLSINAQSIAKKARDMIINPETGEINKQILFEAAAPMGGVGQGRALRSMFMDALDARIRAATGAAVTKEEWPAYFRMYLPGPIDLGSPGLIKDKLDRLDSFIDKYITSLDPSGAMRKTIGKEGGQVKGRQLIKTKAEYDKLPPGTVYMEEDGKTYRKP